MSGSEAEPGEPKRRAPARDGDKDQARQRVNYLVRQGSLDNPNAVKCADCGHTGDDRRHEYDHYLGYAGEHHEDVEAVCTTCHHFRERARLCMDRIHPGLRALAVPIADLRPDPKNANEHPAASLRAIAAAFDKFGQRKNLVGWRNERGEIVISAGNGALEALSAKGWTHLAVAVYEETEARAMAYAIADNETARKSEYNFERLGENLRELLDADFDLEGLDLWGSAELEGLLTGSAGGFKEPQPGEDRATESSDIEELGGGSDTDKAGANIPMLRWGKTRIPLTEPELEALEAAYKEHMNVRGGPFGFVAKLLRGR